MFFYVYALEKSDGNLYVGRTDNLKRRIKEHNQGLNPSTEPYRPLKCVYFEGCLDEEDMVRRERYLKTTQGRRLLKRRLKEYYHKRHSED